MAIRKGWNKNPIRIGERKWLEGMIDPEIKQTVHGRGESVHFPEEILEDRTCSTPSQGI